MKIFKVESMGDYLYFEAETLDKAKVALARSMFAVPEHMCKWKEVNELPPGEEFAIQDY